MRKEVKIGLFAVIVLAATLFVVEFLKGKDIFSKTDTYYIIYPEVDGIQASTAVTFRGFQAGRVTDVSYNRGTMDYTVEVSISHEFSIPDDSYMEIYSSDIMGTRKIRIAAGTSGIMAASGDTLEGRTETDMISSLAGSITPAVLDLDSLIRNLNRAVSSVNMILGSKNRSRIDSILLRLETMSADLEMTASALRDKKPEISSTIDNLCSISSRLDSAAAAASATIANTEAITAALREAELGETVDSIRSLISRLQDPSGSIGRLMTTDSLYNSITRLSNDLDSLIRGIEEDPKKYIKISVF